MSMGIYAQHVEDLRARCYMRERAMRWRREPNRSLRELWLSCARSWRDVALAAEAPREFAVMKKPAFNFVAVPEGEQMDWLQGQLSEAERRRQEELGRNPLTGIYGPGPQGARCKTCQLFHRKTQYARLYFKCALRGNTNGPGTDHRANWQACGRYVAADPNREEAA